GDDADRPGRLIDELYRERYITRRFVLCESGNRTWNTLSWRWNRCVNLVLHGDVIDNRREQRPITQIDTQAELIFTVLYSGCVPDAKQPVQDGSSHSGSRREPEIAWVGIGAVLHLILEELRMNCRSQNLYISSDNVSGHRGQNDDADWKRGI